MLAIVGKLLFTTTLFVLFLLLFGLPSVDKFMAQQVLVSEEKVPFDAKEVDNVRIAQ